MRSSKFLLSFIKVRKGLAAAEKVKQQEKVLAASESSKFESLSDLSCWASEQKELNRKFGARERIFWLRFVTSRPFGSNRAVKRPLVVLVSISRVAISGHSTPLFSGFN